MSSLSTRSLGRRKVAALATAAAAVGGFVVFNSQSPASAHETKVTLNMTCAVAGSALPPIAVAYTVDHEPETATSGELFTISTSSSVSGVTVDVPVFTVDITIPTPAGVTSGGPVTATGGNVDLTGQTAGADAVSLSLKAQAGVTSKALQMPTLAIPVKISDKHPETINFEGPSELKLSVNLGAPTPTEVVCTADDNPPLLSIKPTGGTVVAAPVTTKKTTTTVKSEEAGGAVAVKAKPQFTG